MAIFQSITLGWNAQEFIVPSDKVLGAIGVVEDVVTFPELIAMMSGKPNMSRLARAYGAVLRYAGARITDEEIYDGLFKPGEVHHQIATAINTLLAMMTPPSALGATSEGNSPRAPARSKSSKHSTKRR